jgi:hypothetical protein
MINHVAQEQPPSGQKHEKKHYHQPRLATYGAVKELTASGSNTGMEGSGEGNRNKRE